MSFYTWRKAIRVFFNGPEKPEMRKVRYQYRKTYHNSPTICNECEVSGVSVPAIEHHLKCLTGHREKAMRTDNLGPLPPRKPTPFRPRLPKSPQE